MYIPEYQRCIFEAPSVRRDYCVVCGKPATNNHHVIPNCRHETRDHPESPTLSLCGMGNASGCHGMAHDHKLHFRACPIRIETLGCEPRVSYLWEYLVTEEGMDELSAHEIEDGWKVIRYESW